MCPRGWDMSGCDRVSEPSFDHDQKKIDHTGYSGSFLLRKLLNAHDRTAASCGCRYAVWPRFRSSVRLERKQSRTCINTGPPCPVLVSIHLHHNLLEAHSICLLSSPTLQLQPFLRLARLVSVISLHFQSKDTHHCYISPRY